MAFFSALSLNIFFLFVNSIILVYSLFMGENVGGVISKRLPESSYYIEFIVLLFVNIFLLYICFRIEFWILTHFSSNRRKSWLLFLAMLPLIGILSTIISQLLGIWFKGELTTYQYSIIQFVKYLALFIVSVFISQLIYLIIKNQERMEENKNISIENLKNRYNALKNQTDPHFLFNSFNSLNGLIGYDDERAHEYLEQLSSVFRYTIQEHPVVTLSDELEFTGSYIHLMKIRYGEALSVKIQIPDGYQGCFILPFAIQTLVENAVKHNIVSLNKPLYLGIKMKEDETIIVENNLQPRQDVRYGTGVGLSNLNERYWLMFRKNISIEANDSIFRVEIPLIKKSDKYSDKFIFHNS